MSSPASSRSSSPASVAHEPDVASPVASSDDAASGDDDDHGDGDNADRKLRYVQSPSQTILLPARAAPPPPIPLPPPELKDDAQPTNGHTDTPLPVHRNSSILSQLHALHADELAYLFMNREKIMGYAPSYTEVCRTTVKDYLVFLWRTWTRAWWNMIVLPTTIMDRVSILAFASVSSVVLFFLMLVCLAMNFPIVHLAYETWAYHFADGLSLTNAMHPRIFDELTERELQYAVDALSAPIKQCTNTDTRREFNLDVAKFLLQCSAVMYERTSAPLQHALHAQLSALSDAHPPLSRRPTHQTTDPDHSVPGELLANELGAEAATRVSASLHTHEEESAIAAFAHAHGLAYATLSELNSQSSAICGMFYAPRGNFIVLAYKGTSPQEFSEWASDFTFEPRHAGHWIRGFGKCHGGFLSKIFPKRVGHGTRMPYNTIKHAVHVTATHLRAGNPHKEINVWTTGHSLGCALASFVYARQINEPGDFGHVVIRDAYLFAAPILCDIQSVHAFNNRMHHTSKTYGHHPRTMWRVTNASDLVARALPHQGDHPEWGLSPHNLLAFAHLGTELQLRRFPARCVVSGNHITPGSRVRVVSRFRDHNEPPAPHAPERSGVVKTLRRLERLPLLGRLLAHGTGFYWAALQDVTVGSCEWDD